MSASLLTDILRAIRKSFNRFISIIAIVALGAGFFVGVRVTVPSMRKTAQEYFRENNLMDLRVLSTAGLTDQDIASIRNLPDVKSVQGSKFVDAMVLVNGQPEIDIDGSQISVRAYSLDINMMNAFLVGADDVNFINRPTLIEGNLPQNQYECLVDENELSTPDSYQIGNYIRLTADSNTDLSVMSATEFKIVGVIRTPYYISFERGNSLVGSGKIGTFIYVPKEAFSTEYYSEAYIKADGTENMGPDSDRYDEYIKTLGERVEKCVSGSVTIRVEDLKRTIPAQIAQGQAALDAARKAIDEQLKPAQELVQKYQRYVDDPEGVYNEAAAEAAKQLGLAENAFNTGTANYTAAVDEYNRNMQAYKDARAAQQEKGKQLEQAQAAFDEINNTIERMASTVATTQAMVDQTQALVNSADETLQQIEAWSAGKATNEQLDSALQTLRAVNPELYDAIAGLTATSLATEAADNMKPQLEAQKALLASYQAQLTQQQNSLTEYKAQLDAATAALNARKAEYEAADQALNAAYEGLNTFYETLQGSKDKLSVGQVELMLKQSEATQKLDALKTALASAGTYLEKAKTQLNEAKAKAEAQLSEYESKIHLAQLQLEQLTNYSVSVYDREDTPGFNSYENAMNTVEQLSYIFPAFFFFVAAMVCLTTMTRMVEEERTQLGTLKALGYSSGSISAKYVLYALFASLMGAAVGIVIGIFCLPLAIFRAYSIMFTMPPLRFEFPPLSIILGMLIAVLTTVAAALIVSRKELHEKTAALMRPKAPKPGKRVLLEYIPFIWKHISFTGKVTIRNLFRKKSKLIMTVTGIAGCTALILASTGLFTSINDLMKAQYGEGGISDYDVQLVFADAQEPDSALLQLLSTDTRLKESMLTSMQSVSGGKAGNDSMQDVYLFIPKDAAKLNQYVRLADPDTKSVLSLLDGYVIVTEGFARANGISVGEDVSMTLGNGKSISAKVSAIAENYTFSYVYMTENTYQYLTQEPCRYNYAIAKLSDEVRVSSAQKAQYATDTMAIDGVNAVAFVSDTADALNHVIGVLSAVVGIFIASAALLAFIVLYNMSNINVSERKRELATIKVLGFREKELTSYIFRENRVLTFFGILIGLGLGILVHKLLITFIVIDAVTFVDSIPWYVYLIATLATILFAFIAGRMLSGKIKRTDMVESLKSVE